MAGNYPGFSLRASEAPPAILGPSWAARRLPGPENPIFLKLAPLIFELLLERLWGFPGLPQSFLSFPGAPWLSPRPRGQSHQTQIMAKFSGTTYRSANPTLGLGQEISKPFLLTDGRESGFSPSRQRGPASDFRCLGGRQTPPRPEKPDFPETRAAHF